MTVNSHPNPSPPIEPKKENKIPENKIPDVEGRLGFLYSSMATEESYVPSNKRMKSEESSFDQSKPATPMPITSDEDDSDRELPEDVFQAYLDQLDESDGFDVPKLPPCDLLNPLKPVNIDSPDDCFDFEAYSQHALDEYNRRFQGQLEFVKILKVMGHVVRYATFYITLEANDLADGGTMKTYQTVVIVVSENDICVSSFRLKPPEDTQGSSNQPKEWFWKDHFPSDYY